MLGERQKERDEWFERAHHDWDSAGLLFDRGGYGDTIAFLVQQAVEKYLKGYLIAKGWKLRKTHDLEVLVTKAVGYDKSFGPFLGFSRTLSAYYLEDRYPPGPPREFTSEEVASLLDQAGKLIALIQRAAQ